MTVAVIDYGIGNVQSVVNACRRVADNIQIVDEGNGLRDLAPSHIILPGVGAIGHGLDCLRLRGLDRALARTVIEDRTPFLGICVGMQMLGEICLEFGEFSALSWIPGRVERLSGRDGARVPHVGWNMIAVARQDPVLTALDGEHFYFVHSYALRCPDEFAVAVTQHGEEFVCAVRRDNILGVQFHPEKSSTAGEQLLSRFLGQ